MVTSTASDTPRTPQRASRTSIHSGDAARALKPRTSRSTNRSQAVGSAMLAGGTSSPAPSADRSIASAGSVNGTPYEVASSRATPRMLTA